jgi:hypothetical protein
MLNNTEMRWLRSIREERRKRKSSLDSKERWKKPREKEKKTGLQLEKDSEFNSFWRRFNLR